MKKVYRNHVDSQRSAKYKLKVAVLCGGISSERRVSQKSGARVASALRRLGYRVAVIDPSAEYSESEMRFLAASCVGKCPFICPRNNKRRGKSPQFTASAMRYCKKSDIVFNALHGGAGEDGRIAAALECLGIPFTGSDYRGLCLSMDKIISKRLLGCSGILTPEFTVCSVDSLPSELRLSEGSLEYCGDLPHESMFPCVIKPACGGSSIGVRMVENESELSEVFSEYKKERKESGGGELLIERRIIGREFTVGILCGEPLAVTEIIPERSFYDYESKYTVGATEEITPARIPKETEDALKKTAIAVHRALYLGAYSRIDIMLEKETDKIYVLEANALPGMTETSLLPQGAMAHGISFDALCEKMLLTAINGVCL